MVSSPARTKTRRRRWTLRPKRSRVRKWLFFRGRGSSYGYGDPSGAALDADANAAAADDAVIVTGLDGDRLRSASLIGDRRQLVRSATEPPVLNVESSVEMTIRELAEKTARETGFSGRIVFDATKPDWTLRKVLDLGRYAKVLV
jgi:nucleoside-diphosphate-sugar epimerase